MANKALLIIVFTSLASLVIFLTTIIKNKLVVSQINWVVIIILIMVGFLIGFLLGYIAKG